MRVSESGKEYGMALVCIDSTKECCGCGNCLENDGYKWHYCQFCGEALGRDDAYKDMLFEFLCRECLLTLHKL